MMEANKSGGKIGSSVCECGDVDFIKDFTQQVNLCKDPKEASKWVLRISRRRAFQRNGRSSTGRLEAEALLVSLRHNKGSSL